ncbi:MAG TPA: rhodanese-like domain-containing protein [Pyrinomonadaceae bacterium]|jgi:3-mercaptopyruvate sulfurtransferase SseA
MRLFISLSAALILAVAALTACNSTDGSGSGSSAAKAKASPSATKPPAPATQPTVSQGDGVRRVTTTELKEALDKGTAVVVDVRAEEQYKAGHIKGALHIPEAEIAARAGELPRDKMIVTYCS